MQLRRAAMDGVLEGAAVLCVCKLACSLLVLPSLTQSVCPVSFCCCCLLLFTDLLVTVYLSVLFAFESWLPPPPSLGDAVALRFLLFLCHTYGAVLLLITPVIAVQAVSRAARGRPARAGDQRGRRRCLVVEITMEQREADRGVSVSGRDKAGGGSWAQVGGYLCCLTVWVVVGLNVSWQLKVEELWARACLHTSASLIRCLPNLFSPMHHTLDPCWGIAFLSFILFFTAATGLVWTQRQNPGGNESSNGGGQQPVPEPQSEFVGPEKTESGCGLHRTFSWDVQTSKCHHGDTNVVPLPVGHGGRTPTPDESLTFNVEVHEDSLLLRPSCRPHVGFLWPGSEVAVGFLAVLAVLVLPLNLSVNVVLIRTLESLFEACAQSLRASTERGGDEPACRHDTGKRWI